MRDLSSWSHRASIDPGHSGGVSGWVKTLVVLALVVPMTAYVAGSLVSSRSYDPSDRAPVIIQDAPTPASSPDPTRAPERREKRRPSPPPGAPSEASPDGSPDASPGPSTDVEENDATVVTPKPRPVDDDDDDDDDGPDGDDDDDEADDREDDADDDGDDD
jgi:hypothetical protein